MTREAKIGMLTGLGVIVLIGVLLSEYLGDKAGVGVGGRATGQMAPLPVGAGYRQQVLAPVAVPAMTPAGGGERTQLAGGTELTSPIATGNNTVVPSMYAADAIPTGPGVGAPVTPIPAGPTLMDGHAADGAPSIITLAEATVPVRLTTAGTSSATVAATSTSTTYTIAAGDTLAKIAKRFYNSTKNSDVQRIVAANPSILKDASSMLVVNKKLVIPLPTPVASTPPPPSPTPPTAPRVPVSAVGTGTSVPAPGVGIVMMPSGSMTEPQVPGMIQPPTGRTVVGPPTVTLTTVVTPDKAKTYVVQSGDTLEKIARKMAPTKVNETVQKLISTNGLKDPSKLKVDQVLKLPV